MHDSIQSWRRTEKSAVSPRLPQGMCRPVAPDQLQMSSLHEGHQGTTPTHHLTQPPTRNPLKCYISILVKMQYKSTRQKRKKKTLALPASCQLSSARVRIAVYSIIPLFILTGQVFPNFSLLRVLCQVCLSVHIRL